MFIVLGSITIAWGVIILIFLPDSPSNARFLSEEEKIITIQNVTGNLMSLENHHLNWKQVKEGLTDVKVYLLFLIAITNNIAVGGATPYSTLIIKSFGFTTLETALVNIPLGFFQGSVSVAAGYVAYRFKSCITYVIMTTAAVALIGSSIVYARIGDSHTTSTSAGLLFSFYMITSGTTTFAQTAVLGSVNTTGRTKKTLVMGAIYAGYGFGNLIGPFAFLTNEAPKYTTGFTLLMVCWACNIIAALALRIYFIHENRRRDLRWSEKLANGAVYPTEMELRAMSLQDLTDFENEHFRYHL